MFNIMNLNNIENIFYWTDNNGAVSLPGDTALTYRTKSDLPRFVAAVYGALNTDSGVSERVVTLNGQKSASLKKLKIVKTTDSMHSAWEKIS